MVIVRCGIVDVVFIVFVSVIFALHRAADGAGAGRGAL
jgi:hypothetical protein